MGQRYGYRKGDLPVTENLSGRLLRLPMYAGMREEELQFAVAKAMDILKKISEDSSKKLIESDNRRWKTSSNDIYY